VTSQTHRSGRLEMANRSRAVTAARGIADHVTQAVLTLGAELPDVLSNTATLRLAHPEASMAELGRLSDPPVSKNVIAGRLRRLLVAVDRRQAPTGVPA
jgi:cell division protein WhiA